jgi:hypothetical protein
MKKHSKGHVSSLYYSCKAKRGNAWNTTQLVGHTSLKELTHVIRFTKISLFQVKLRLTSCFLTSYFVNRLLHISLLVRFSIVKLVMLD